MFIWIVIIGLLLYIAIELWDLNSSYKGKNLIDTEIETLINDTEWWTKHIKNNNERLMKLKKLQKEGKEYYTNQELDLM